jgi:hypothetical protein
LPIAWVPSRIAGRSMFLSSMAWKLLRFCPQS